MWQPCLAEHYALSAARVCLITTCQTGVVQAGNNSMRSLGRCRTGTLFNSRETNNNGCVDVDTACILPAISQLVGLRGAARGQHLRSGFVVGHRQAPPPWCRVPAVLGAAATPGPAITLPAPPSPPRRFHTCASSAMQQGCFISHGHRGSLLQGCLLRTARPPSSMLGGDVA